MIPFMKHFAKDFNDNCYELNVLQYFANLCLTKYDIEHYYIIAPLIVSEIEKDLHKELIYDYIYDNLIDFVVKATENDDYDSAYKRYYDALDTLEITYINQQQHFKRVKKHF